MKSLNVELKGGPHAGKVLRVAKPGRNINQRGQRNSLRIRVGYLVGAYDLVTGAWQQDDPQS